MRKKQLVAGGILAMTLTGSIFGNGYLTQVSARNNDTKSPKGLWITEIYNNDVDRSSKSDKRESDGYNTINLFDSKEDLMEFIEITNTSDNQIDFNKDYKLFYEAKGKSTQLDVTHLDGSSNVVIEPGESVVFWNKRTDIDVIPTEAQLRQDLRIPDKVKIVAINSNVNWATKDVTFKLTAADGDVCSEYTVTDSVVADGLSVELSIPDMGDNMNVYSEYALPSAGTAYSGQLNGQTTVNVPEDTQAKGLYVTEIFPNDTNRSSTYGTTSDVMECFEITNTTDTDIDLNKEYELDYVVKESYFKSLPLYTADLQSQECILPAHTTAVIWCHRGDDGLAGLTSYPTEEEFRKALKIPDEAKVFAFTNQNGMNNTNRGIAIFKKNSDGTKSLVSNYSYNGVTDLKDNRSVDLMVNPEGPEMLRYKLCNTENMGTVAEGQITYLIDDGSSMKIELNDVIPESIMQGEEIDIEYNLTDSTLPRTGVSMNYRFDGEGDWICNNETSQRVPSKFFARIPANELFSHDYVEFYVSANNRYRSTKTEVKRININKINSVDGIRSNISDNENVKGTVTVTANDGKDNANTKIYIDDSEVNTVPMIEDGSYFSFLTSDRDSYFLNALATADNEIITGLVSWKDQNGKVVKIDNHYYTYDAATDKYKVTLRFWAGTQGATVEDIYEPTANREDFKVTQIKMLLANGKEYLPVSIGPDDTATSAKTNLDTAFDTVHAIGDSAGMCPYMDVSFEIPASEVTAVGYQLDTSKLSDGTHKLKVTDGTSTKESVFVVDNTAPVIKSNINEGDVVNGKITINPEVTDANSLDEYSVLLDGNPVTVPYETTSVQLKEGNHKLEIFAKDAAGNESGKTVNFKVGSYDMELENISSDSITKDSSKLSVKLGKNTDDAEVTFYEGKKLSVSDISTEKTDGALPYITYTINTGDIGKDETVCANWDGTASNADNTHAIKMYANNINTGKWDEIGSADENGSIKGEFKAADYTKDGKATVMVQCTADSALAQLTTKESTNTGVDNSNWDGTNRPQSYDFCIPWITDTQYYAESYQNHFLNMNQWIVDNAKDWNMNYVIHTGDIVDEYDMTYQWENASEAMAIFDKAGISYGVLGGNHDVAAGANKYENYNKYFGEDRFKSQPTYGGSYDNNKGHYDLISQDGQDMIFLYMSWDIGTDELNWMNQVLSQYSDRKAFICLHRYINVKQTDDTYLDYTGVMVQNEVVAKNPNVVAVLNGHYHGSSYETMKFDDDGDGVKERTVYQICTDYQSGFEGGAEYIKMLYFDLSNDKIYINSYSPYYDDFNYYDESVRNVSEDGVKGDSIDSIVLDMDFDTEKKTINENTFTASVRSNNKIGTVKADKDGVATYTWNNLKEDTAYTWYAVATNSLGGKLATDMEEFTTTDANATVSDKITEKIDEINNAASGEKVAIDMSDTTVISKEVLDAAKGKDIDVVLNMDGYSWIINGKDISGNIDDTNLAVELDTKAIPESLVNEVAAGKTAKQISIAHDGELGFKAELLINVGKEYAGQDIELYYYDETAGKLVSDDSVSGKVREDGTVVLSFSHASDYLLVLDDAQENISDGKDVTDKNTQNNNNVSQKDTQNQDTQVNDKANGVSNTTEPATDSQALKSAEAAKTGDSTHFGWLMATMAGAAAVLGLAGLGKKKKKRFHKISK